MDDDHLYWQTIIAHRETFLCFRPPDPDFERRRTQGIKALETCGLWGRLVAFAARRIGKTPTKRRMDPLDLVQDLWTPPGRIWLELSLDVYDPALGWKNVPLPTPRRERRKRHLRIKIKPERLGLPLRPWTSWELLLEHFAGQTPVNAEVVGFLYRQLMGHRKRRGEEESLEHETGSDPGPQPLSASASFAVRSQGRLREDIVRAGRSRFLPELRQRVAERAWSRETVLLFVELRLPQDAATPTLHLRPDGKGWVDPYLKALCKAGVVPATTNKWRRVAQSWGDTLIGWMYEFGDRFESDACFEPSEKERYHFLRELFLALREHDQ
jgi:hypothetical protein